MNYLKVATEIASFLRSKNDSYGDAISVTPQLLRILFNKSPDLFDKRIIIMVRVLDKICREATKSDIENWKDIAGYAIRMVCEMEADFEGSKEDLSDLAKADQSIVDVCSDKDYHQYIGTYDSCNKCGFSK